MPRPPSLLNWKFSHTPSKHIPSYWRKLPYAVRPYDKCIPTFAHGKKVTFGDLISTTKKKKNKSKTILFPNILTRWMYSRVLDMNIFMRISSSALRVCDEKGGFDEYIVSVKDELINDRLGLMYKRLISSHYLKRLNDIVKEENNLLLLSSSSSSDDDDNNNNNINNNNNNTITSSSNITSNSNNNNDNTISPTKAYEFQLSKAREQFKSWSTLNPKIHSKMLVDGHIPVPSWPNLPAYAIQVAKSVKERSKSVKY